MSGRRRLMMAMESGGELFIEMGLDSDIVFKLDGDAIVAEGWNYGGIGTHHDLERNYPDLYFGSHKCYANGKIWDLHTPLRLGFAPAGIARVELPECGRDSVSVGEQRGACYIVWTDTEIHVADNAGSSSRYLIKITFK